ncbi:MAG TPA: hypothetical protein ENJ35_03840 [Gammaproteobacteria bacterium]|nr:hypothetical protein [Gammaproteobacteria bacterium]
MIHLNNILTWRQTLPKWQRDAFQRLLQREEGLLKDDYSQLYVLLKAEYSPPIPEAIIPEPLALCYLPVTIPAGETITNGEGWMEL